MSRNGLLGMADQLPELTDELRGHLGAIRQAAEDLRQAVERDQLREEVVQLLETVDTGAGGAARELSIAVPLGGMFRVEVVGGSCEPAPVANQWVELWLGDATAGLPLGQGFFQGTARMVQWLHASAGASAFTVPGGAELTFRTADPGANRTVKFGIIGRLLVPHQD